MLEANPLHGIVQLDVDSEIVRIELQLVARADAAIFLHVDRDARKRAIEVELQMRVAIGLGLIVNLRIDRRGHSFGRALVQSVR